MDLNKILDAFIEKYINGTQQRDASWFKLMGTTVGGSEIAALLGYSPYSNLYDVASNKLAILEGRHKWIGGDPCWWGTLFEDVLGAYVEIDLGGKIKGDNICVQERAGHRNSPDGYIVANFYYKDGRLHLLTTDTESQLDYEAEGCEIQQRIILLEFKCPISRKPNGKVPKHYIPQLWSGLAVSPVANFSLFVDSVFRKCSILDLEDTPDYDTNYHDKDRLKTWGYPIAWGIIGVFAPKPTAPIEMRITEEHDASHCAWEMQTAYFSQRVTDIEDSIVDFGDIENKHFSRALMLIDSKKFLVTRVAPWLIDGRGNTSGIDDCIRMLKGSAGENYYLMGIIPWKLFEINYVPVDQKLDFFEVVMPLIDKVHRIVAESRTTDAPQRHLSEALRPNVSYDNPSISNADLQSIFDQHIVKNTAE